MFCDVCKKSLETIDGCWCLTQTMEDEYRFEDVIGYTFYYGPPNTDFSECTFVLDWYHIPVSTGGKVQCAFKYKDRSIKGIPKEVLIKFMEIEKITRK